MHFIIRAALAAAGLVVAAGASASTAWVGSADYAAGPNGITSGGTVTSFGGYDFGPGALLLTGSFTAGSTVTGYFQTYVSGHLGADNSGVSSTGLNPSGVGSGYELTLAGSFQERVDSVANGQTNFTLQSGHANLYLGAPNYSFSTDSGFTDGKSILSASITGGSGWFSSAFDYGVTNLNVNVDSYDHSIFSPDTISGGTSIFSMQAPGSGFTSFLSSIGSVQGNSTSSGLLLSADGNMSLTAVPLPPALWLFGSGLVGLVGLAARRRR
ncbi:MAG: flocculation-associated PEP-CTERM protein PepA [Gammaproteobacteria bacterium]